jgi:hypothetical protein
VKAEPSDIDTETAATTVPAGALSGRDAVFGVKVPFQNARVYPKQADDPHGTSLRISGYRDAR